MAVGGWPKELVVIMIIQVEVIILLSVIVC